jgi:predicted glycosyltransferase
MSSFHYVASEKQGFEVEAVGDHEYLVRVHGTDEDAEAWFRVTPEVLDGLGLEVDEATVVRRTVAFLLQHQDASDFPAIVEIEDVLASYPDFRGALAG